MTWKKIPDTVYDSPSEFERMVIDKMLMFLSQKHKEKIYAQLSLIKKIKRIDYKIDSHIELFVEKLSDVPEEVLFEDRSEFELCRLKLEIAGKSYTVKFFMVLGLLFEIQIKPGANTKNLKVSESDVKVMDHKIKQNYADH